MITSKEERERTLLYEHSFKYLTHIHRKVPTIMETILYMMTIKKEDTTNIIKLMEKQLELKES